MLQILTLTDDSFNLAPLNVDDPTSNVQQLTSPRSYIFKHCLRSQRAITVGAMLKVKAPSKVAKAKPKPRYYILFVEDPTKRTPFSVVPASKIDEVTEEVIGSQYLNSIRRKRSYPRAVCPLFNFGCRVFAKAESKVTVVRLNKLVTTLNEKYKLLLVHVPVEKAYSSLLEECPNKVKDGIEYMTAAVTNKRARKNAPPDTASSYTETENKNGSDCEEVYVVSFYKS